MSAIEVEPFTVKQYLQTRQTSEGKTLAYDDYTSALSFDALSALTDDLYSYGSSDEGQTDIRNIATSIFSESWHRIAIEEQPPIEEIEDGRHISYEELMFDVGVWLTENPDLELEARIANLNKV